MGVNLVVLHSLPESSSHPRTPPGSSGRPGRPPRSSGRPGRVTLGFGKEPNASHMCARIKFRTYDKLYKCILEAMS
jgi:hypothetical protein